MPLTNEFVRHFRGVLGGLSRPVAIVAFVLIGWIVGFVGLFITIVADVVGLIGPGRSLSVPLRLGIGALAFFLVGALGGQRVPTPISTATGSPTPIVASLASGTPSLAAATETPKPTATSQATPPPTPEPTAVAAKPITISGKGISKSTKFPLAGDYEVTWTAKASSSSGCYHGASLERADGTSMFELLVNEIINDAKSHTGTTNLYNVDAADYYVDASSGCTWSFTFTSQ
jgi:hypothetical protein